MILQLIAAPRFFEIFSESSVHLLKDLAVQRFLAPDIPEPQRHDNAPRGCLIGKIKTPVDIAVERLGHAVGFIRVKRDRDLM